MEKRFFHKDGHIIYVSLSVSLFHDAARRPLYFISQVQDVTQRKLAERALVDSQGRLALALSAVGQGTFDEDLAGGSIIFSAEWAALLGFKRDQGRHPADSFWALVHPEDRAQALKIREDFLAGVVGEYRATFRLKASGQWRWVVCLGAIVARGPGAEPLRLVGTYTDVTERKQYQDHIEYLATHDPLTGLVNKNILNDRLYQAKERADRNGEGFLAVLCLGLDRFNLVNNSLGHEIGDLMIKAVAQRLRRRVRRTDTVARYDGDEFVLLIENLATREQLLTLIRTVDQALRERFVILGKEILTTASIGVSAYPADDITVDKLLWSAKAAMFRAKQEGGGGFSIYNAELGQRETERFTIERALRQALERREFELYYQPLVRLADRKIVGMEALIRWNHGELGFVLPDRFIALAEETGLIIPIGDWVLRTAAAQLLAWRAANLPETRIAVNVSARQFAHGSLLEVVTELMDQGALRPHELELEITESAVMRDVDETTRQLATLKEIGVDVSIDDFGTGHSSLAYLRRLPVRRLKIDRSFVREIGSKSGSKSGSEIGSKSGGESGGEVSGDAVGNDLVQHIVSLAHTLGLAVVAEGIESAEQLAFLTQCGCDEGQGFYLARPMPAADCEAFLRAGLPLR
jgi:diguanylate cyclase (GGDEF)-like protein/PAS domain S-box-containing protein